MRSQPKKGHCLIQNPFGAGIEALSQEMDNALKKCPQTFSAIKVSGGQVHYVKLGFKKDGDGSPTGTHRFVGELPPYDSTNKRFPTVGLVTRANDFVALPLLSHFVSSVLYTGLATRIQGKDLTFMKGSFLKSVCRMKEDRWLPTVDHSDFDPKAQAEGKAQPITFVICLKGETPLDFGSLAKDPSKPDRKVRSEEIVLKCGDGVVFSWRQQHKTGRPRKFPTGKNHRIHFMLSGSKSDVNDEEDDKVYIHPNPKNMDKYDDIERTLGK